MPWVSRIQNSMFLWNLESNLWFPFSFQLPFTYFIKSVHNCRLGAWIRWYQTISWWNLGWNSLVLRCIFVSSGFHPSRGLMEMHVVTTAVLLSLQRCWPRQLVCVGVFSQLTSTIWFPMSSCPLWKFWQIQCMGLDNNERQTSKDIQSQFRITAAVLWCSCLTWRDGTLLRTLLLYSRCTLCRGFGEMC